MLRRACVSLSGLTSGALAGSIVPDLSFVERGVGEGDSHVGSELSFSLRCAVEWELMSSPRSSCPVANPRVCHCNHKTRARSSNHFLLKTLSLSPPLLYLTVCGCLVFIWLSAVARRLLVLQAHLASTIGDEAKAAHEAAAHLAEESVEAGESTIFGKWEVDMSSKLMVIELASVSCVCWWFSVVGVCVVGTSSTRTTATGSMRLSFILVWVGTYCQRPGRHHRLGCADIVSVTAAASCCVPVKLLRGCSAGSRG